MFDFLIKFRYFCSLLTFCFILLNMYMWLCYFFWNNSAVFETISANDFKIGPDFDQEGLADAIDKDYFKAKLASLKPAWEVIAPGFHCWFQDNRSEIFIECLVLAAREKHSITQRFSTNALEAKRRLQKKTLNEKEVSKEIVAVTECCDRHEGQYRLGSTSGYQSMSTSM